METDAELTPTKLTSWSTEYKEVFEAHTAQAFPQTRASSCAAAMQRGVRQLDERARGDLPQDEQDRRRRWAPRSPCRRWCSATWATTAARACCSPATPRPGSKTIMGEFLPNAQGEDVVAGIRTPVDARQDARIWTASGPEVHGQLTELSHDAGADLPGHGGRRVHGAGRASCTSCRAAPASAARRRPSRSRSIWSTEGVIDTADGARPAHRASSSRWSSRPLIDPVVQAGAGHVGPASLPRRGHRQAGLLREGCG